MKTGLDADDTVTDLPEDAIPEAVRDGATVALCGFDPTELGLGLHCLHRVGSAADSAVVVATVHGVEPTVEAYTSLSNSDRNPAIGVVDMVSEGQSISAMYGEVPTVFTPSEGDTERLVLALSELTEGLGFDGERHLIVRSLSPMLGQASTDRVTDVVERISGLRTEDGVALFGLNYTSHDTDTVQRIASAADRVLWVSRDSSGDVELDLRSTRADFDSIPTE